MPPPAQPLLTLVDGFNRGSPGGSLGANWSSPAFPNDAACILGGNIAQSNQAFSSSYYNAQTYDPRTSAAVESVVDIFSDWSVQLVGYLYSVGNHYRFVSDRNNNRLRLVVCKAGTDTTVHNTDGVYVPAGGRLRMWVEPTSGGTGLDIYCLYQNAAGGGPWTQAFPVYTDTTLLKTTCYIGMRLGPSGTGTDSGIDNIYGAQRSIATVITCTPSGGIRLGGSAPSSRSFAKTPSAGIALGGSRAAQLVRAHSPSGGIRLGGSAVSSVAKDSPVTAGIYLDGSVSSTRTFAETPSAGIRVGGSVVAQVVEASLLTGGIALGGSATSALSSIAFAYQWQRDNHGDGNFVDILGATTNIYTTALPDIGNRIRCRVTATYNAVSTAANSNILGPIIPTSIDCLPYGGIRFGGSASTGKTFASTRSGGIVLGGSRSATKTYANAPIGGIRLGGTVGYSVSRGFAPAGGIRFGGSPGLAPTSASTPTGGIRLAGRASAAYTFAKLPTGGIVLGGFAAVSMSGGGVTAGAPRRMLTGFGL
jgi:hypothetical protein